MSICTYLTEITGSFCRKLLGTGRGNSVGSRCSLRMQAAPVSTLASDTFFQGECLSSFLKKSKLYVTSQRMDNRLRELCPGTVLTLPLNINKKGVSRY